LAAEIVQRPGRYNRAGRLESFFGQFGSFKSAFVSVTRGMNLPMVFFATSKNTVEKSRPS
jgi:hypothetical protein